MRSVRIKYLGLLPIRRRTYLAFQFIIFLLCIAMMVVGLSVMLRTNVYVPHMPDRNVEDDLIYQILLSLFWLGLLILLAEGIETIVMLRKFARAEAAKRAESANFETPEPVPSAPSPTGVQLPPSEPPSPNLQP